MSSNTDFSATATVTLLGKPYVIRCAESEVAALEQAADYLNKRLTDVQESGKAINLERIALITALNITHQFLQLDNQKQSFMGKISQHIANLQDKLDSALNKVTSTELVYAVENLD